MKFPKNSYKKPKIDKNHLSLLYLEWVKTQPCAVCGNLLVDPHHVDKIGSGGNRKRVSKKHFSALSLCRIPHHRNADKGPKIFEEIYGVNIWELVVKQQSEFLWQLATGQLNELIREMSVYEPLIGKLKKHWIIKKQEKK